MEKRVHFRSPWLPWVLLAPQMHRHRGVLLLAGGAGAGAVAAAAGRLRHVDVQCVGLDNFRNLLHDPAYLASFTTTAVFSLLVAFFGLALSLLLAVFADRVVRGAMLSTRRC